MDSRGSHRPADTAAPASPVDAPAPRPAAALEPASHTVRDLGVLVVVVVVLALLIRVGSGVEHTVPVAVGNRTITNVDEVLADAEAQFQQIVDAQATRVAAEAGCYLLRPLGPTQGALPAQALPPQLGMPEDAEAVDIVHCGPVELVPEATIAPPGAESQPWVAGIVYHFPTDEELALRAEFQTLVPGSFDMLASLGGVAAEHLIGRDGRHPEADAVEEPTWREVTPSGDPPPTTPGLPGGELPPEVSVPELPPEVGELPPELPPDQSVPELPPDLTLPEVPDG